MYGLFIRLSVYSLSILFFATRRKPCVAQPSRGYGPLTNRSRPRQRHKTTGAASSACSTENPCRDLPVFHATPFHCLDAHFLTGFSRPPASWNPPRSEHRKHREITAQHQKHTSCGCVRSGNRSNIGRYLTIDAHSKNRVSWVRVLVPLVVKSPESLSDIGFRGFFLGHRFWG